VPFHISTIKSINKTEEGQKAFLRINFYSIGSAPGSASVSKLLPKPDM
jgi:nucleosome binding factor SPN SPT16 subunit